MRTVNATILTEGRDRDGTKMLFDTLQSALYTEKELTRGEGDDLFTFSLKSHGRSIDLTITYK